MSRSLALILLALFASGGCRACSNCSDHTAPLARSSYNTAREADDYSDVAPLQADSGVTETGELNPTEEPARQQAIEPTAVSVAEYLE